MSHQIRELLLVHHCHTDIGYTHGQAALWELQARFIERALDLCDATAGDPVDQRFFWTCECTAPILHWLRTASPQQIHRFKSCVERGQLGAGALHLHYTPLIPAAAYAESLRPITDLRKQLGLPLKVGLSHDVNGLPWSVVTLLQQAGVEMLIVGANIVYGGHPLTRPLFFNWVGPDGTPLLCLNAEHYNAFSRETNFHLGSTDQMAKGLDEYFGRKLPEDWPYDFAFLTATNPHFADNNPPLPRLLKMINRWNVEGREPFIRLVQPETLMERVRAASAKLPVYSGDWTDFWNFGCGSSMLETGINRATHKRIFATELLAAGKARGDERTISANLRARENALLWNEHTWTAARTLAATCNEELACQWTQKAATCWTAQSLSLFALRERLEEAAGKQSGNKADGLLVYNPSGVQRHEPIRLQELLATSLWPEENDGQVKVLEGEAKTGKREWDHLESRRHQLEQIKAQPGELRWTEPILMEPYSLRWIPKNQLRRSTAKTARLDPATGSASCNGMTLQWDPETGRILKAGADNKSRGLEADTYPVFGYVYESPDIKNPSPSHNGREAFFHFDWDRIHADIPGWKQDWKAIRNGPEKLLEMELKEGPEGVTLIQHWQAPGVSQLVQRTVLRRDRPAITFEASFTMGQQPTPEGIYFVFPTNLGSGWQAHYDTADVPVEFEHEQLPGVNLDFVTVDRWICAHDNKGGIQLTCPDAPLVQVGEFSFGKRRTTVSRDGNPLLVGWATNNYWMTNFPPSQPGRKTVRYEMNFVDTYDPVVCSQRATPLTQPLDWHPVMGSCPDKSVKLAEVNSPAIRVLDIWQDGNEWHALVVNESLNAIEATVRFPLRNLHWSGHLKPRVLESVVLSPGDDP